jgi:glycosyltransferase involved in cell wall biosynthesis
MPYLKETAESVSKLDLDYEWIVIDNVSADGSGSFIEQIATKNNKVRCFYSETHFKKPLENYKRGLIEARGKYVLFLDADDTLTNNNALKESLQLLESKQDVQFTISKVAYMDEKSKIYKIKQIPFVKYDSVVKGKKLFWIVFFWPTFPLKFGAVVIRKNIFDTVGLIFDIDFILEFSQKYDFYLINDVGLNYRNIGTSFSSKNTFALFNYWIWVVNKYLPNERYWGLKYFIIFYKITLTLLKYIYRIFSSKRI